MILGTTVVIASITALVQGSGRCVFETGSYVPRAKRVGRGGEPWAGGGGGKYTTALHYKRKGGWTQGRFGRDPGLCPPSSGCVPSWSKDVPPAASHSVTHRPYGVPEAPPSFCGALSLSVLLPLHVCLDPWRLDLCLTPAVDGASPAVVGIGNIWQNTAVLYTCSC